MLSVDQKILLSKLETHIEEGVQASLKMAQALTVIKESELYKDNYHTFSSYCYVRWGFEDRYARLLLDFAKTAKNLEISGSIDPATAEIREWQTRPLNSLPAEKQVEAFEAAKVISKNSTPRGVDVQKVVKASRVGTVHEPDQKVTVLEEKSPFYGKPASVVGSEYGGLIVRVKVDDQIVPFLPNQLSAGEMTIAPSKVGPKPETVKSTAFEALQSKLEVSQRRVEILTEVLFGLISAYEAGSKDELKALIGEAKNLI